MNNLLWMLETATGDGLLNEGSFAEIWTVVWPILKIVIYAILAVLGVVLIIKGITTALAVVKAADEPQVRQEKIGSFKYMAIGVVIAAAIVAVMAVVLNIFTANLGIEV